MSMQPEVVKTAEVSEVATKQEKVYCQFSSTIKSCRMVMPDGRGITFLDGVYRTDREDEIEYLRSEIKNRHPHLSEGAQVTAEDLDPIAALRKKIIQEYEAEKAAGRDMGSTTRGPLIQSAMTSAKQSVAAGAATGVHIDLAKVATAAAAKK